MLKASDATERFRAMRREAARISEESLEEILREISEIAAKGQYKATLFLYKYYKHDPNVSSEFIQSRIRERLALHGFRYSSWGNGWEFEWGDATRGIALKMKDLANRSPRVYELHKRVNEALEAGKTEFKEQLRDCDVEYLKQQGYKIELVYSGFYIPEYKVSFSE